MRSKNNYHLFIILGLMLFLGVGYAVVNSVTLTITGTAGAGSETLNVAFTGTTAVSNQSKGTATVNSDKISATFSASNMSLNETNTFAYEIKNSEVDVDANVQMSTTNSNSEYYSVEIKEVVSNSSSFRINAGDTVLINIIVKMIKTPITSSDSTANFTISINATPTTEPELITFSIAGITYQAEKGMTWGEWIDSEYNTGGFIIGNYNYVQRGSSYVGIDYTLTYGNDVIIANQIYKLGASGNYN